MLVVSRKPNQSIMIGDEVRVIVLGFEGDHVRIGIEAPRTIPVHRCEIYEALHPENPVSKSATAASRVGKDSAGPDNPR